MQPRKKTIASTEAFRLFLLSEYENSCRKNARFSLRAYSRKLGLDSSTLSRILKGKRTVSRPMFLHLSHKMGLGPEERQRFEEGENSSSSITAYKRLSIDTFSVINDWYHFAILGLIKTSKFKPDIKWVAGELGLTVNLVQLAVERLERVGLLTITKKGEWLDLAGSTTTGEPEDKEVAYRNLQIQLLQKAIESVERLPTSLRDQSSMILSMNPKRMQEVKTRIDKFRAELTRFLEEDPKRERLYALLVSFFPLTQKDLKQENSL